MFFPIFMLDIEKQQLKGLKKLLVFCTLLAGKLSPAMLQVKHQAFSCRGQIINRVKFDGWRWDGGETDSSVQLIHPLLSSLYTQGYSTSETWYAVLDSGTNYCNLHNLITGVLSFDQTYPRLLCLYL